MSIAPINGSGSHSDSSIQPQPAPVQPSAPVLGSGSRSADDTVHLSEDAQVKQLSQGGQSASAIASSTGLSVAEVDSDLGITTAAASAPVATPAGSGGGSGGSHAARAAPAAAPPGNAAAAPAPTLSVRV